MANVKKIGSVEVVASTEKYTLYHGVDTFSDAEGKTINYDVFFVGLPNGLNIRVKPCDSTAKTVLLSLFSV